jgi:hypothetical protein
MTPSNLNQRFIGTVFFLLGVGVLIPWNACISAKPYFQSRLCNDSSAVSMDVELWFSVVYNIASVLSLAVLLLMQYYQVTAHTDLMTALSSSMCASPMPVSISARGGSSGAASTSNSNTNNAVENQYSWWMVMGPLGLYLAVFIWMTVLVLFPNVPPTAFLLCTLGGLFLCGFCTSVASAGIVGTAGLFPADTGVNPYFQGQAAGGLLVAAANTVTAIFGSPATFWRDTCRKTATDNSLTTRDTTRTACAPYRDINWETFVFFCLGCVVLVFCMLGYSCIEQYKQLVRRGSYAPIEGVSDEWMHRLRYSESTGVELAADNSDNTAIRKDYDSSEMAAASFQQMKPKPNGSASDSTTYTVWKAVQGPAVSLFLTYMVTLALFPVITSNLSSTHECQSHVRLQNDLYLPITFLIFNAGDLVGRVLVTDVSMNKISRLSEKLVWSSVARLLFVPLFFLCYSRTSVYAFMAIDNDLFSMVVQFLFAVTNGMLTSLCFMQAPGLISSSTELQQISSAILNFSLCSGLLLGSFGSFPLHWAFTGHW